MKSYVLATLLAAAGTAVDAIPMPMPTPVGDLFLLWRSEY
jgi:hypothetical protein